jgi:hypothetical protein
VRYGTGVTNNNDTAALIVTRHVLWTQQEVATDFLLKLWFRLGWLGWLVCFGWLSRVGALDDIIV